MHEILNYAPSSRGEETSDWLVVAGSKRNMCLEFQNHLAKWVHSKNTVEYENQQIGTGLLVSPILATFPVDPKN